MTPEFRDLTMEDVTRPFSITVNPDGTFESDTPEEFKLTKAEQEIAKKARKMVVKQSWLRRLFGLGPPPVLHREAYLAAYNKLAAEARANQ